MKKRELNSDQLTTTQQYIWSFKLNSRLREKRLPKYFRDDEIGGGLKEIQESIGAKYQLGGGVNQVIKLLFKAGVLEPARNGLLRKRYVFNLKKFEEFIEGQYLFHLYNYFHYPTTGYDDKVINQLLDLEI